MSVPSAKKFVEFGKKLPGKDLLKLVVVQNVLRNTKELQQFNQKVLTLLGKTPPVPNKTPAVAGSVIGAVLLVGIVVGLVIWLKNTYGDDDDIFKSDAFEPKEDTTV